MIMAFTASSILNKGVAQITALVENSRKIFVILIPLDKIALQIYYDGV